MSPRIAGVRWDSTPFVTVPCLRGEKCVPAHRGCKMAFDSLCHRPLRKGSTSPPLQGEVPRKGRRGGGTGVRVSAHGVTPPGSLSLTLLPCKGRQCPAGRNREKQSRPLPQGTLPKFNQRNKKAPLEEKQSRPLSQGTLPKPIMRNKKSSLRRKAISSPSAGDAAKAHHAQ